MRTVKMGVLGCRRRQASHVEAGRNSRDAASRTENDTYRVVSYTDLSYYKLL